MLEWNLHIKDLLQTFKLISQVSVFSIVNVNSIASDEDVKKEVEHTFIWANMSILLWIEGQSTLVCQLLLFYSMLYAPNNLKIHALLNPSLGQIIYFLPSSFLSFLLLSCSSSFYMY